MFRYGLRCGEVVGEGRLPGIRTEDLRADGIMLLRKLNQQPKMAYLKPGVLNLLRQVAPTTGKIFDFTERQAERIIESLAKKSGIDEWHNVTPHRLRAFFATDAKDNGIDAFTIRDLMDHKNIQTTQLYVGRSSPDHMKKTMARL